MKNIIKQFLKLNDLRILKISKNLNSFDILEKLITKYDIDCILDIGANEGQFAKKIKEYGYKKQIISFEPLSSAYSKLLKNSHNDINWEVFRKIALGDSNDHSVLNVSNYSPSSSILPFTTNHLQAKPKAIMTGTEKIEMAKLDSLAEELNLNIKNVLLKIDAQGYESKILNGSNNVLNKCKIVFCEVSFKELYKGQELWTEILNFMLSKNFKIASIENGFFNEITNELLQADVIFIKND
jgi:FkbM family methyltransferase